MLRHLSGAMLGQVCDLHGGVGQLEVGVVGLPLQQHDPPAEGGQLLLFIPEHDVLLLEGDVGLLQGLHRLLVAALNLGDLL